MKDKDGEYCLFSTKDENGGFRESGWYRTEKEALNRCGSQFGYDNDDIVACAKRGDWQFVRYVSPSELLGTGGYQVGDRALWGGKECEVRTVSLNKQTIRMNDYWYYVWEVTPLPPIDTEPTSIEARISKLEAELMELKKKNK